MIRIKRSKSLWSTIEGKHKEFFLNDRLIKDSLSALKIEYQRRQKKFKFLKLIQRRLEFIEYLETNIEEVLIGKPKFLRKVIEKSEGLDVKLRRKNYLTNNWINTKLHTRLLEIFNYDNDFKVGPQSRTLEGSRLWTAYHLVDKLNINVCPYCNRIYTNTFYSLNEGRTRPHLDHYYSKSIYPFLAISLYNLIPSCYSCNSNFKLDKDFYKEKHLHPYENSMGKNIKFTLRPIKKPINVGGKVRNGYDLEFTKGKLEAFKLMIDSDSEKRANLKQAWANSNSTFHLEEMYATHKDVLHEMIQKSKVYKEEYADWLEKRYVGKIFKSRSEIDQMIIGNYINEKDFGKRPLAKLTYDISKELKILK